MVWRAVHFADNCGEFNANNDDYVEAYLLVANNYAKKHRCAAGSKERVECVNKRYGNYVPDWR